MAERRMFAKTIVDSDAFLDMPLSSQSLYFHLSMRADDEGFINNPKKIQRILGCADDDLKLLIAKKFLIPFESGVVVIKHWKIHNYIRKDRLQETVYQEEKNLLDEKENGSYTLCQPHVSQVTANCQPGDSIGKDRLGEDSIDKDRLYRANGSQKTAKQKYGIYENVRLTDIEYQKLINDYGCSQAQDAIQFLSAYREEKGYKNKNDYLSIKRWVFDAVNERKSKTSNPFKEALKKEIENEEKGSHSYYDGYQGGLSKLLQEPSGN